MGHLIILFCLLTASTSLFANTPNQVWQDATNGKSIIMLRHALAPGNGDPGNFKVNQCSTQRNLSTEGAQQAQRIGKMLKNQGIEEATVYTSQWCRCIDTANAMAIGPVTELPELNSFYATPEAGPAQIENLLQWLNTVDTDNPTVLVTHQVVITALTGVYPASGEAVIFTLSNNNEIEVTHRVKTQ